MNSSIKDQNRSVGDVVTPQTGEINQDTGGYALSKFPYQKEYMDTAAQARDTSTGDEYNSAVKIFAAEAAAPYDVAHDPDLTPNEGDHDTPARLGLNYHID